jgi:resolvase-like protein
LRRDPVVADMGTLKNEHRRSAALAHGVYLLKRQSSLQQRLHHLGSNEAQEDAREWVRAHGFPPEDVIVIDARGESGQAWENRECFRHTLQLARAGRIGVLILPLHSRAGRHDRDTLDLIEAIKSHRGYILAERRWFDPTDPQDELMLKFQATLADYYVKSQSHWLSASKFALARSCAVKTNLPTCLVWGMPDAAYCDALRAAGKEEWLGHFDAEPLPYQCGVLRGSTVLYPLWVPDADVIRSAELRLEWLFETRSVAEVLRRIQRHSAWPRPGLVPARHPQLWQPGMPIQWRRPHLTGLRYWLRRPSLFGIYSFTHGASDSLPRAVRRAMTPSVFVRGAFPAYRPSRDYDQVATILQHPPRPRRHNAEVLDQHLLSIVRCAQPLPNGRLCGRELHPTRDPGGWRYVGRECSREGHTMQLWPTTLEGAVLDLVQAVLTPSAVREGLAQFRLSASAATAQLDQADREIAHLEGDLVNAEASESQSRREARSLLVERARERQVLIHEQLIRARQRRSEFAEEAGRLRTLAENDLAKILDLARNLPALLEAGRRTPPILRAFLGQCLKTVWVRRVGTAVFELGVEFPTGAVVQRLLQVKRLDVPGPAGAWMVAALTRGCSPAEVAAEANRVLGVGTQRTVYSRARVAAAAALYAEGALPSLPSDIKGTSLLAWADESQVPPDRAIALLLRGKLGLARIEDGSVIVAPSEQQCRAAFRGRSQHRNDRPRMSRNLLDRLLAEGAEDCRRLPVRPWVLTKTLSRWPQELRERASAIAPALSGRDATGAKAAAIWLGPRVLEQLGQAALETAVKRLGSPELPTSEFHPLTELACRFAPVGGGGLGAWAQVRRSSRFIPVTAWVRRGDGLRRTLHVHVPAAVWDTDDEAVLRRWLQAARRREPPRRVRGAMVIGTQGWTKAPGVAGGAGVPSP